MNSSSRYKRNTLMTMLSRPSPFGNETGPLACGEYEPLTDVTTTNNNIYNDKRILIVGAGGLGCEIIKDIAMSCIFKNIDIIDLDTIDITNLNRQFLFRHTDIGHSKANVAATFINNRCPWMNVKSHFCKIQDKDLLFYSQFTCIISGLDNIEARRWLNAMIVGLVQTDEDTGDIDPTTIIPIIDGGTEAWSGQARIILPKITSCFECTVDSFPPATTFPLCTIAETPRRSEHCIAYAYILEWPRHFPDQKLDKDSPKDMKWIYEKALERSIKYNIPGVTYMHTLGVVKNIIPAVASTNAIIAAICVNEAIKYITYGSQNLNNYMMYMGSDSIHSHTFVYQQKDDCIVCSNVTKTITISNTTTLCELIQLLKDSNEYQLTSPSIISSSGITLYMPKPPSLEIATRPNLDKPISTLINNIDEELTITDPLLESINLSIAIKYN